MNGCEIITHCQLARKSKEDNYRIITVSFQTFYFYYSHNKNDKVFIFSPAFRNYLNYCFSNPVKLGVILAPFQQ